MRPNSVPEETIIGGLRRHLQRMAAYKATGEIEIHVQHGKATYIKPARLALSDVSVDYLRLDQDQAAVISQVAAVLVAVAPTGASGQIWVVVETGVPQYPVHQQFLEYFPQAS